MRLSIRARLALLCGGLAFLAEWGGLTLRSHQLPYIGPPRPLGQIWWHLPVWVLLGRIWLIWHRLRAFPNEDEPTKLRLKG